MSADSAATSPRVRPQWLEAERWPSPARAGAWIGGVIALLGVLHLAFGDDLRHDLWHLDQERNVPATFSASLLSLGGIAAGLVGPLPLAVALVFGGELISRYLFYVTVVPLDMPGSFSRSMV